jgi:hypothetical protein
MEKNWIIKDRNLIAYLLATGFTCDFVPRPEGGLDAEFPWSVELENGCKDYLSNKAIPVQSFVAASKHVSDRIRDHKQRQVVSR